MSDSDDMPPPLEDMSAMIENNSQMKKKALGPEADKSKDHVEEVRLAPKKKAEPAKAADAGVSVIKPRDENE